jgi:hypothetical protein
MTDLPAKKLARAFPSPVSASVCGYGIVPETAALAHRLLLSVDLDLEFA